MSEGSHAHAWLSRFSVRRDCRKCTQNYCGGHECGFDTESLALSRCIAANSARDDRVDSISLEPLLPGAEAHSGIRRRAAQGHEHSLEHGSLAGLEGHEAALLSGAGLARWKKCSL